MGDISEFLANIMIGMAAVDSVVASIREDAIAGIPMSPAQQLTVANMMESNTNFIRIMVEAMAQYEEEKRARDAQ